LGIFRTTLGAPRVIGRSRLQTREHGREPKNHSGRTEWSGRFENVSDFAAID
jgi:hypothetical protein